MMNGPGLWSMNGVAFTAPPPLNLQAELGVVLSETDALRELQLRATVRGRTSIARLRAFIVVVCILVI